MSKVELKLANSSGDTAALLNQFRITPADLGLIAKIGKKVIPNLQAYIDEFYVWLSPQPYYRKFFPDDASAEKVKALQVQYWKDFFEADVSDKYIESRRFIGSVHAMVEMPIDIYLSAMNVSFENFIDLFITKEKPSVELNRTLLAVSKLMHLDQMITAETYSRLTNEKLLDQSKSLIEMSTPVTSIWEGILILPLVGIIDSKRALDITGRVLEEISLTQATCFILDISGVAVIDTAVANYMIKITKATKLMGCESIISGLSPAIAQTIVDLGIDVGNVQTTGNLSDALKLAFGTVGLSVAAK